MTTTEAQRRLAANGPNTLPVWRPTPVWRRLAAQLTHFFALYLWAAAALAVVAGLPQLSAAIAAVVVINAVFAFVQEYRAERAAERIAHLLPRRATVVRDGVRRQLDAADLVVGDLIELGAGDQIAADARVVTATDLRVDTALLTGESVPVPCGVGDALYGGTFVAHGVGTAIVKATGEGTRLAGIAALTQHERRPTSPLTQELHRVARAIAMIAGGVGVVCFMLFLALRTPVAEGVVFAIGITVALVPEGLLPTVTLSLAVGAQRMARRNALVRRLDAVETLGSTTFICTDKTGTLTHNEMSVVTVWTPAGAADLATRPDAAGGVHPETPEALAAVGAVADALSLLVDLDVADERDATAVTGDPTDVALAVFAQRAGVAAADPVRRALYPFDAVRRRMSVVAGDMVLVKGAPESVLPRCAAVPSANAALDDMAERGLRVLAVATRALGATQLPAAADEVESGLELLGLVGLEDPPREHAAAAVADCRRAGLKVAMVTGDHPATAAAIAREVGLARPGAPVVTGADLPTDDAMLAALVDRDGIVIARVTPEDKLRIARALQERGHVVAMTGDGVNDGPALQAADIGVAMGKSGTDVARAAADLVLLDDDFATIVAAVEQGRATFSNARKFLTYHLCDNVAELTPFVIWALSGGRFPLALTVLQILALDIGTDSFSAVALGAEAPARHALHQPPARGRLLDATVRWRAFGLLGPLEGLFTMAAFTAVLVGAGWLPGDPWPSTATMATASGAAFATVVLAQSANAFACRSSTRSAFAMRLLDNRLLLLAVAIELTIAGALLFQPAAAALLGHAPPTPAGWLIGLCAIPSVIALDSVAKRIARRMGAPA